MCPGGTLFDRHSVHFYSAIYTQPWSYGGFMRYWVQGQKPPWVSDIENSITAYLNHCRAHSNELDYKDESISHHENLSREFFAY